MIVHKPEHGILIHAFAHGIEERRYTTVAMSSEHFVVFRIKGHKAWASVGYHEYISSQYVLIRKGEWWLRSEGQSVTWHGRIAPKVLRAALNEAEENGQVIIARQS